MKEVKSYLQIFEVKKRQDIEKQTNQFNFLSKHKKLELFAGINAYELKRYEFNVGERKEDLVTEKLVRSSKEERRVDALALRADEGRDKLR